MDFDETLLGLGLYMILIILFVIIPLIAGIIIRTHLATEFGFSGIEWWIFVIFYNHG